MDFGTGDLGFTWEIDPAKRREVAKKVLPAFSTKAIKAKEPTVQMYIDSFVEKMKELGSAPEGVSLNDVRFISPLLLIRIASRNTNTDISCSGSTGLLWICRQI